MIYYLFFPVYESWEAAAMYFLLLVSVILLWIPKLRKVWPLFYALTILFGLVDGRITHVALIPIFLLGACAFLKGNFRLGLLLRALVNLALFVIGIDMLYHIMPGFYNWKFISLYRISPNTVPFNLYLNVDKITVGLFLASALLPLCKNRDDWKEASIWALKVTPFAAIALLLPSLFIGYVAWDPKLSPIFPIWALTNLFFVSFTEEVFYRGFIQTEATKLLPGKWTALLVTSILFGINHYPGGPIYIALSTLAGLFYGYGYQKSGKIETSILIHFSVNTLHFILFSYPSIL